MLNFPYIFTFYSFKGGVGRSLALLNVAYTLAHRGRHVLVVDMDLEAPGISGFLQRQEELAPVDAPNPLDVLSLLTEAVAAVKGGALPKEAASKLPPVSNYRREVRADKLASLRPRVGQLGRLDVIAADMARDYWKRFSEAGLQGLPQDRLIALSELLHHYFKQQRFAHRPAGLEPFEPPVQTPYDYVLVDSRTGISEVGGLCVGPLADRLVVLTGLNDQNVQGTLSFMREAGIQPQPRTEQDQLWDEADVSSESAESPPSLGPKPTLLVASPVPHGEITFKRERLRELEKLLGIRPRSLSYHPQMALLEGVFVRDFREEYLAGEYASLTDAIMALVIDHPVQLAERSRVLWNEKNRRAEAIGCIVRLAPHQPELGLPLLMQMGNVSESWGDQDSLAERQLHALLSQESSTKTTAYLRWGNALLAQAKTKQGEAADRFFGAAGQKYAEALKLKPDDHETLNNWGNALLAQAKTKQGEAADRFFEAAGQKYAEALKLKPDDHETLNNWGVALCVQAKTKQGEAADRLVEAAAQKYAEALKLKPDFHEALNNWGGALSDQAKTKQGEAADRLVEAAGQKYAEALKLKPDFHEALNNWGATLVEWSYGKSGAAQKKLRQEARKRLSEADKLLPGSSAYNLACLEAAEGNVLEAVNWLKQCIPPAEPLTRKRIAEDRDFDRIRNEPVFAGFLENLPPE